LDLALSGGLKDGVSVYERHLALTCKTTGRSFKDACCGCLVGDAPGSRGLEFEFKATGGGIGRIRPLLIGPKKHKKRASGRGALLLSQFGLSPL